RFPEAYGVAERSDHENNNGQILRSATCAGMLKMMIEKLPNAKITKRQDYQTQDYQTPPPGDLPPKDQRGVRLPEEPDQILPVQEQPARRELPAREHRVPHCLQET
ncbi:Hypothetical predicted protein, partial [Paramuricea clavata]